MPYVHDTQLMKISCPIQPGTSLPFPSLRGW